MVDAFDSIKLLVSGLRDAADLAQQYKISPLYEKIVQLQAQVTDLTIERGELVSENQELKEKLALQESMEFRNPYWYQKEDEVPFCPKCYEGSQQKTMSHLTHPPEDFSGGHGRQCRVCKEFYREGPRNTPFPTSSPRARRASWKR